MKGKIKMLVKLEEIDVQIRLTEEAISYLQRGLQLMQKQKAHYSDLSAQKNLINAKKNTLERLRNEKNI